MGCQGCRSLNPTWICFCWSILHVGGKLNGMTKNKIESNTERFLKNTQNKGEVKYVMEGKINSPPAQSRDANFSNKRLQLSGSLL